MAAKFSTVDNIIQVFDATEVIEKLKESTNMRQKKENHVGMYSSVLGGITLDSALMVIPMDDHMVHRGHGVFDTTRIVNGYLYEVDKHIERFLQSASKAKINISPFPHATIKNILLQLVAASLCKNGSIRFYLSSGPGNFLLSPSGCPTPTFYAVVIQEDYPPCKQGVKVITSTVPMKQPLFATSKNVNYLPNVLSKMLAEEKGAYASVWVDDEGFVAEGSNLNVAFVSKDGELLLPCFDKILGGITARILLELAPKLVVQNVLKSVKVKNITVAEAKNAAEMMYLGSNLPILPIIVWDDNPIGDGNVGKITMALSDLLYQDMVSGPERIPVQYAKK
ncbi:hypothetical protein MKX03_021957 [Papaver bracteatum]|nr:hypothetical protein MKX03_021957 [Papaver bracteatum]